MVEQVFKGAGVTVTFDSRRCIHSRNCVLGLPGVFLEGVRGEWVRPDGADPEAVVRAGINCPSGAIRVARDGGEGSDAAPAVNRLRLCENGPLAIEAELSIAGEPQASPRATLCRCGASKRKPFCDGSHGKTGFMATGEPEARELQPLEARGGPLEVAPQVDGPLRVSGNLEIVSGTGRCLNRVRKAFFCRCGQSRNKPYCDSSHKTAGFRAEGAAKG